MSDDLVKVSVCEGKYTFGQREDGSCYALRYGEPWREDIFDGLTLAMAHRIEELEAKLAQAMAYHAENARILGHVVDEAQGQIAAGKLAALEECRERSATIKEKNDE